MPLTFINLFFNIFPLFSFYHLFIFHIFLFPFFNLSFIFLIFCFYGFSFIFIFCVTKCLIFIFPYGDFLKVKNKFKNFHRNYANKNKNFGINWTITRVRGLFYDYANWLLNMVIDGNTFKIIFFFIFFGLNSNVVKFFIFWHTVAKSYNLKHVWSLKGNYFKFFLL